MGPVSMAYAVADIQDSGRGKTHGQASTTCYQYNFQLLLDLGEREEEGGEDG